MFSLQHPPLSRDIYVMEKSLRRQNYNFFSLQYSIPRGLKYLQNNHLVDSEKKCTGKGTGFFFILKFGRVKRTFSALHMSLQGKLYEWGKKSLWMMYQ